MNQAVRLSAIAAVMDIPKVKSWPNTAVQCDDCGGYGCATCKERGWVERASGNGRLCYRPGCFNHIHPDGIAVFCSLACARANGTVAARAAGLWNIAACADDV